MAATYTRLGYDVFLLDYRGYGKSEGHIGSQAQLLNDVEAAYKQLQAICPEQRTVVVGYSVGTAPAAWLAARHHPRLLLLHAPYYSRADMAAHAIALWPILPGWLLRYPLATSEFVQQVNTPVVLFHGDHDEVIPYRSSVMLGSLLKSGSQLILLQSKVAGIIICSIPLNISRSFANCGSKAVNKSWHLALYLRHLSQAVASLTQKAMAPYAFVDVLGGPSVVGEPIASDLQLVDVIQRGLRRRALDHLARRSHLPLPVLAAAVDLSVRTLQRYAPEQRLKADATDRLVQLAILYAEGFELFGEEKFRHWMESPLLALGHRKPLEFITSMTGIRLLRDIFVRIEYGVFG